MKIKNNAIFLGILILIFITITLLVVNNNLFVINLNNSVKTFIENNQSSSVFDTMLSVTKIGNFYEVLAIFLVFGLFLILRNKKYFCIFSIATFLGAILPLIIKIVSKIQRPSLLLEQNYSFPSSHATISIIFLFSSIFLLAPLIKEKFYKIIFIIATSVVFPLVAFSRIYLSVHWTTDVIAGIILGAICFIFAKIICCQKKENVL